VNEKQPARYQDWSSSWTDRVRRASGFCASQKGQKESDMKVRLLCGIAIWVAIAAVSLQAQDTGAITGTVRDSSGAVIAGAEVKVGSTAGGNDRTTATNSDGEYLAAGLPGGTYGLTISAKGFKTYKADGIVLRVAQKARIDVTLTVGNVQTEVVVQGTELNQVETQSSDLAGTVTGRQMTQLELNGRNFTQLLSLTPGATNQSGNDEPTGGLDSVVYSVNGGRTEYNNWEIDGGNNMDDGSNTTLLTFPSIDAIAEVRVLSSNYGAQYGRNSSGTVEVETKSGTRSFHGVAYEFVRNDAFNARNFFSSSVPPYKKNDFGYTIGGPFFIPNVYNQDRSKTFFFFSQEWRRNHISTIMNAPVPSCAERGLGVDCTQPQAAAGDFSELCPGSDCPINPATGNPFTNNLVPIDPNALPLLPMIPLPTEGAPGSWAFNKAVPTPTDWREELFRIDHNINAKLHASVRYIHDSWNAVSPSPLWTNGTTYPTIQTAYGQPSTSLVVRLTATVTPTLLNEFVASYSTNHITTQNTGPWQRPNGYNLGLFQNGFGGGKLPGIQLSGGIFDGLAEDAGWVPNGAVNSNPSYTYRDNVSKIVGKHNLQFGGYFVASQKNELPQFDPSVPGFAIFSTSLPGSTGNAFADMLTGNIDSFQQASGQPKYYLRYKIFEPYFQDDWHVTPRLTLNLGLRISLFGTIYENLHQAGNFDPTKYVQGATTINATPGPLFGTVLGNTSNGLVLCGTGGVPTGCAKGHLFNPAPRIGFAWDVFGNGKTAVRGGYGIFFEHTNGNEAVATALEGSPPLVQNPVQSVIPTDFNPNDTIEKSGYLKVGVAGAQFPQSVVSIPQKQIWPYVQQWHFDIERELPSHVVAIASYVGSKGTHLGRRVDLNQIPQFQQDQNPYQSREPFGPDDCSTGMTPSLATIPGYTPPAVAGNPADPSAQIPGTIGVNMYVACGNDPNFFRPFLGYGDIRRQENASSSIYHALQLSARRAVGSLQLSASYTYSHSIDDASSGGDGSFVDSFNFAANRANSNFDQRHVFSLSYTYDLPFFKGSGLTHTLLGGWQWSGITLIQTGTPFSVTNGGDGVAIPGDNAGVANGVGTSSRPDLIGNPNTRIPDSGATSSFGPLLINPGAFAAPRGLTFGTAGRNIVRNPRQTNFDMALFKHFPVRESVAFEFRAEAFNVFNHTEFGYIGGDAGSAAGNSPNLTTFSNSVGCYAGPNNTPNDPSCLSGGLLRPATAHNARILQLGLKLIF
jgi:Carboxypeptidase regulatory-like domain/TonB-dependent Receptor Plug Domain